MDDSPTKTSAPAAPSSAAAGPPSGPPTTSAAPAVHAPSTAVKSADRTVELLELLARTGEPMTLSEIHRQLSYPKSSLFVLLRTLVARGWVETDRRGTGYSIGVRALLVGTSYLDRDPVLRAATRILEQVRAQVDETVHLARLDGGDVVYLASRESTHQLRLTSRVGRRLPAHSTALGKALLAQRSDEEVTALLPAELPALSPKTLTELPALLADLAETRARGYAAERGENTQGLGCVAVALAYREPALDAISCSVPLVRLDDPAHAAAVLDAVREGARELNSILRTL